MTGLYGLVIFVMYVTGGEMMMEVMVGHLVYSFEVFIICSSDLLTVVLVKEIKVKNVK